MDDKLRIVLTPEESEEFLGIVAITFTVREDRIIIGEEWEDYDELWAPGVSINIPRRVWDEGLAWLARTETNAGRAAISHGGTDASK